MEADPTDEEVSALPSDPMEVPQDGDGDGDIDGDIDGDVDGDVDVDADVDSDTFTYDSRWDFNDPIPISSSKS